MKIYLEEDNKRKYRTQLLKSDHEYLFKKQLYPLFVAVGLCGFTR
jgi:hypothetical protein